LILEYECSRNLQLNFYTTEFLSEIREDTESNSVIGILGSNADEGRHGYNVRSCLLKKVPIDFDEIVDIELISCISRIPGTIIET